MDEFIGSIFPEHIGRQTMSIFRRHKTPQQITWQTPGGQYNILASKALEAEHTLIAGATGCGKSTFLHAIMQALLVNNSPASAKLILCDPKAVELKRYARLPHVLRYETEDEQILAALNQAIGIMQSRYEYMASRDQESWTDGAQVYVIIEELSDLLTSTKKRQIEIAIQRLTQKGRAAGIHVIAATQAPSRRIIKAEITLNFTARFGLACESAIESKQIVGAPGCEDLPDHGQCIYKYKRSIGLYVLPFVQKSDIMPLINYWTSSACRV